jgi:hypothetical protein
MATGDATFKFGSDLVDLGISFQHSISPTVRAADAFDCFSIAAHQWFLNVALVNSIIARDAPIIAHAGPLLSFARATIVIRDARRISPRVPELSLATRHSLLPPVDPPILASAPSMIMIPAPPES